jgi:hypothetical protein
MFETFGNIFFKGLVKILNNKNIFDRLLIINY